MGRKKLDRTALRQLFGLTRGKRGALLVVIIGNALFAASGAAFALFCRGVIDAATAGDSGGIIAYALLLCGVVLLQLALRLICNMLSEKVRAAIETELRGEMFGGLLSAELSDISGYHTAELVNRMFSDVRICAEGAANILPSAVNLVTQLLCAGVLMIVLQPWFAAVFAAAGIMVFAVLSIFRGRLKGLHRQVQEKEGKVRALIQETLSNMAVVRVFSAESTLLGKNAKNQREHYDLRMKRRTLGVAAGAGFGLIFQAGYVLALVWGGFGIFSGTMSYGTLTAVLQLVNQIQSPFAGLSSLFPQYYAAAASAERIMEIERLPHEENSAGTRGEFTELRVDGVRFSYGGGDVLTRADMTVKRGEIAALTGISGGGKTTLFMLIFGMYRPQAGKITLVTTQGECAPCAASRRLFAYVPQGNGLFSGTIRENIAFAVPVDDERIMRAARTACAEEFIMQLPDGLDTVIGENGAGLSEGQAQRIAVARAVYSGADFLLMDEATSALDADTEYRLLKNIAALDGKTALIVTHRPAALEICSRKFILKDGVINEQC